MDTLPRTEPDRAHTLIRRAPFRGAPAETPRRLILIGAAIAALVVAFAAVLASGASSSRGALSTMSSRTAEVSALNDLYFRLNDMDAQAANALLVGFRPTIDVPTAVNAAASLATYESDRAAASADLERIALNPALADQYTKLLTALGGYEGLVAQAVYLDQNGGPQQPATPPVTALALYAQASGQMHADILPIAQDITNRDTADVNGTYSGDRGSVKALAAAVAAVAVLLAAALLAAHWYLGRHFRRMLIPPLAAAAVAVLATGGLGLSLLLHETDQLKTAKSGAFDSINALTNARAVSYDANADESRWLLERTPALQQDFFDKVSRIRGLLAAELRNVTFPGEGQAANKTVTAFNTYDSTDATIRSDANAGDNAAAVKLDIGTQPGQSNYDFYQYDTALQSTITINQNAFQRAIGDGIDSLSPWTWLPYAIAVAVLALTGAALYPRLREYR